MGNEDRFENRATNILHDLHIIGSPEEMFARKLLVDALRAEYERGKRDGIETGDGWHDEE